MSPNISGRLTLAQLFKMRQARAGQKLSFESENIELIRVQKFMNKI